LKLTGNVTADGASTASITSGNDNSGGGSNPGQLDLNGANRTFTVGGTSNPGLLIGAQIVDPLTGGAITKAGTGIMMVTGANTYAGGTTINAGTLIAAGSGTATLGTGSLNNTASVTVNTGGTLLFGATDVINHSATVALNVGGTISMQGLSNSFEKMGALTLGAGTGTMTINFGTGSGNTLTFDSLNAANLTVTDTLSILNWTGSYYAAGATTDTGGASQDRLLFTTDPTGAQLQYINFYNDSGAFIGNGIDILFASGTFGTHEIAPVPEPSTIFGSLCLLGLLGWSRRRQIQELGRTLVCSLS
jgi:fibronectin-binding autotransporter adhesin